MKTSWQKFFRRVAAVCLASGFSLWHSACCYAANASDNASDPVYNDGWQAGDNGGSGFTPWDFSSSLTFGGIYYGQYSNSAFHAIDDGLKAGTHYSNPFNNIGRSWALGIAPDNNGVPRAGRGFSLGIGETLRVTFDNPTDFQYFKGYQIRLNGGTDQTHGNICYGGNPCNLGEIAEQKVLFQSFVWGQNPTGLWSVTDAAGVTTPVIPEDTASAGAVFAVTRTGAETYNVSLDSLDPSKPDFAQVNRTFDTAGEEVDWIEFTFFNTPTDLETPPAFATDFYIRSMEIVGSSTGPAADFDNNGDVDGKDFLTWQSNFGRTSGATKAQGDANGNGTVDGNDFAVWKGEFGTALVSVAAPIPEPTGLVVALAGFSAVRLAGRSAGRRAVTALRSHAS